VGILDVYPRTPASPGSSGAHIHLFRRIARLVRAADVPAPDLPVLPDYRVLSRDYAAAMAADGAFNVVEQFHAKAGKGAKALNIHFIAAARANTNAAFDFAQQLMAVTSPSEFFELSAAHARKQFEMLNEQIKQISALVQKAATESAQPLQAGAMKALDRVA